MTPRDRIVLTVLASVALLGGTWFLLLAPKREEAAKAAEQVTAAQSRIDSARGKLAAGEAAKREYAKHVLTIARMGKAVPPTDDTATLIYQLERAARDADVDFRSFKVEPAASAAPADPAAAGGGLTPMPFKVAFNGEFSELRRFMDSVQSFAKPRGDALDVKGRLLTVDGVSMGPNSNPWPMVTAELVVSAYTAPVSTATDPIAPAAGGTAAAPAAPPASGSTAAQTPTPPPALVGGLLP